MRDWLGHGHWRRRLALIGVVAALLAGCASGPPPITGTVQGRGDSALPAQLQRLAADPLPPDAPRYIFIGAAMNGRQQVFESDIRLIDRHLAAAYGPAYRSVLLSNRRIFEGDRDLPLATIEQLDEVFEFLAAHPRPGDRFIVLLATHGMPGLLEVEQSPYFRVPRMINAAKVASWMDALSPHRTWLLLSACYSGSLLPSLYQTHVLTMTAASAQRSSFGCSDTEVNTWYVNELAASLDEAKTFAGLQMALGARITRRETARGLLPSMPQIKVGEDWTEGRDARWNDF